MECGRHAREGRPRYPDRRHSPENGSGQHALAAWNSYALLTHSGLMELCCTGTGPALPARPNVPYIGAQHGIDSGLVARPLGAKPL